MTLRFTWLPFAFFFLLVQQAAAQGGYAGAFLRNGIGPRSEAMGRAYVAMVEGNESAFFNPASVALFQYSELTASLRVMSLDRSFEYLSFGLPIRPKADSSAKVVNGGLSLSWIHAGVDNISARDLDGQEYGSLSNSENAFNLSFGLAPDPRLAIGVTGRVVLNRLNGVTRDEGTLSTSSFGFDLGAIVQLIDGVRVGVAANNLSLKYTWKTEEVYERGTQRIDKFPKTLRAGVAVSRFTDWLTVSAELEKGEFRNGRLHFGALANFNPGVQLRAGLSDGQPALGGGYRFGLFGKQSELHYAFAAFGDQLDSDHVFGWVFIF
ncbi:MAG: hypothetical protein ACREOO_29295 [bacterium]